MIKYSASNNSKFLIITIFDHGIFIKKNLQIKKEIRNYNYILDKYCVPKRIGFTKKYIIYEFNKDLYKNTLHEYLYFKDTIIDPKKIFIQMSNNLSNFRLISESKCQNKLLYKNRIHILKEYKKLELFKYTFIFENKEYSMQAILNQIITNISKKKNLCCYISQGDPTDTNISPTGIFTDFDMCGLNSIIGDIAVMTASIFTHGNYFYPKYHKQAYKIRNRILNEVNKYKQEIKYEMIENKIYLYPKLKIPVKNKNFLLEYFSMIKSSVGNLTDFKYLKYYLCMRMLTPMRLESMDEEDKIIIVTLVIEIMEYINDIDDLNMFITNL